MASGLWPKSSWCLVPRHCLGTQFWRLCLVQGARVSRSAFPDGTRKREGTRGRRGEGNDSILEDHNAAGIASYPNLARLRIVSNADGMTRHIDFLQDFHIRSANFTHSILVVIDNIK